MALAMARPIKDPKTGVYLFKQRVPLDLKHLRGESVTLPVAGRMARVKIGEFVQASLRTKEPAEAKTRYAILSEALGRHYHAHRQGPQKLTTKAATALAGRLYHSLIDLFSDNPGEPDRWLRIETQNLMARAGKGGMASLLISDDARKDAAREERFGPAADALLAYKSLVVDAQSRLKLVKAVESAVGDAVRTLSRNAAGDYTPDPTADRFPTWSAPDTKAKLSDAGLTVMDLFEAWRVFHEGKLAPASISRYRPSLRSLADFVGQKKASAITGDDVFAWAQHRQKEDKINPKVINKNDLVAVSSIFGWAMEREGGQRVAFNPAKGIRLRELRSEQTREKTFRDNEVSAILRAADAVQADPSNPTLADAKRWCPWLAAFSGARIAELTGLIGTDVRIEGGTPVMDFRKTKTSDPRTVPIHEYLVTTGFMRFAASRGDQPLFYDPARHNASKDPAGNRAQDLARWVREATGLDREVAPNHGWRHTWKSKAMEIGMPERISDAITGHSVKKVSDSYRHPTVKMMADALAKFPRYKV